MFWLCLMPKQASCVQRSYERSELEKAGRLQPHNGQLPRKSGTTPLSTHFDFYVMIVAVARVV